MNIVALEIKNQKFIPIDEFSSEFMFSLKPGVYQVAVKKTRNPRFHNQGMALIRTLFDNQEEFDDFDVYFGIVKISVGHFKWVDIPPNKKHPEGYRFPMAKSISFANMDNLEFEVFYNKVVKWAMGKYNYDAAMFEVVRGFCG